MDTLELLNKYLREQNNNQYPKILIPNSIQKALTSKPELRQAEKFGSLSWAAGAAGLLSLGTPIGWIGLLGAGAAIFYDTTEGYKNREIETEKENKKVKAILNNPTALKNYIKSQVKTTSSSKRSDLKSSDARTGKYDHTLLMALKDIPECDVKSGEGLNLSYVFTPDVIIHVPTLNLWIDVEVDEPWFLNELGKKQPIHYIGKDNYRDRQFLDANWVVIRFAEEQVAKQPKSCAKEIANFLSLFDLNVFSRFCNVPDVQSTKCWNEKEALEVRRY